MFKQNQNYFREALNLFLQVCLSRTFEERMELNPQDLYEILRREFVKESSDFTMPFFFSIIDEQQRDLLEVNRQFVKLHQAAEQAVERIVELENEIQRLKSKTGSEKSRG